MKCSWFLLLFFVFSDWTFAQNGILIHHEDGTKFVYPLSAVDSVTFTSVMVSVDGGTFTAGTVLTTISSFTIDRYEVTYNFWSEVRYWALNHGYSDLTTGQDGSDFNGTIGTPGAGPSNSITMLNWFDAVKWCNARSEYEGLTPVYYTGSSQTTPYRTGETSINASAVKWTANGYRLPTEAEWEYAAKGGIRAQPTPYTYSGSNTIVDVAWYDANSGLISHSVGLKAANELGIFDMTGNVWEWCWDWTGTTYPSSTTDPIGPPPSGSGSRIIRGGSYSASENMSTVIGRGGILANTRNINNGIRCVRK